MSEETLQSLLEDATIRYHELLLKNYAKLTLEEKLFLDNFSCYKQLSLLEATKTVWDKSRVPEGLSD